MKEARSNFGAIATSNFIYVFGGVKSVQNNYQPVLVENSIERFSISKQYWEVVDAKFPSLASFGLTSDLSWNSGSNSNVVYILGGTDGTSFKSDLWKLSMDSDTVTASNVDFTHYETEENGQLPKDKAQIVQSKL